LGWPPILGPPLVWEEVVSFFPIVWEPPKPEDDSVEEPKPVVLVRSLKIEVEPPVDSFMPVLVSARKMAPGSLTSSELIFVFPLLALAVEALLEVSCSSGQSTQTLPVGFSEVFVSVTSGGPTVSFQAFRTPLSVS
jgi:hypothetical protein